MALHLAERMAFRKQPPLERQQLLEAVEEIVAGGIVLPPPQRVGGHRVGARRAAETEIDAAGKQPFQHLEALGDLERRVVRQHHAAGADAQVLGRRRDLPDHDVGRRARDVRHVVMLGHPVAGEAQPVGEAAEIDAVAQRLRAGDGGGDGRQVENGERESWQHELACRSRFCHDGWTGDGQCCGMPGKVPKARVELPKGSRRRLVARRGGRRDRLLARDLGLGARRGFRGLWLGSLGLRERERGSGLNVGSGSGPVAGAAGVLAGAAAASGFGRGTLRWRARAWLAARSPWPG